MQERTQCVYYNGNYSSPCVLQTGTPQGSILGPLLFSIFANDLPNASDLMDFSMYADDCNAGMAHENFLQLVNLTNQELQNVYKWITANNLTANYLKLNHMLYNFRNINQVYSIKLGNVEAPRVDQTRLLGLVIDEKLTWKFHTNSVASKISQVCGVMYQIRNKLSKECLRMIYYALVYSHLIYGICLWGCTREKYLNTVVAAQKRAVRTISSVGRFQPSHPLFVENNFLKLKEIYKYFVYVLVFKFVRFNYCQSIFTMAERLGHYNLRNITYDVTIPRWRKEICRRTSFYQGPHRWNELHMNLKGLNNVATFKRKCKDLLLQQQNDL